MEDGHSQSVLLSYCLYVCLPSMMNSGILRCWKGCQKNGIVTKATITAKYVIFSKTYNTYVLQYKYHVNNDSTVSDYVASSNVKKYIYNSQTKGDEIEITYNRMNPIESSYGNILNASKREIFMYNWLYYLSLIVFIILLMLITVSMSFDAIRQSKNIGNKLNL